MGTTPDMVFGKMDTYCRPAKTANSQMIRTAGSRLAKTAGEQLSAPVNSQPSVSADGLQHARLEPVYQPQNVRSGSYSKLMRSHDRMGTRHLLQKTYT